MLDFLFRRLTAEPNRAHALFAAATREARQSHWYRQGEIPDTIDGRFAVLATIVAMILVRLERGGEDGDALSVALTERFIEVMESEHRELGLGDPTLGRTVRKLVGSVAKRTELWRSAVTSENAWRETTRESLYRRDVPAQAVEHSAESLRNFWSQLDASDASSLSGGELE